MPFSTFFIYIYLFKPNRSNDYKSHNQKVEKTDIDLESISSIFNTKGIENSNNQQK